MSKQKTPEKLRDPTQISRLKLWEFKRINELL